ncbi:VOC family protein [Exiguobacterium himgiriensis]|uniref:VOC family protein n=1 Tax=Exiguobacterium himgiriensis TaxID=384621 RepID=UPI0021AFFD0F|nr:VOC family protein [Exiguobacterium himgiriensis]MCT4783998.1 VOC family protein [Exiguobacterium himgiriensis]
MNLIQQIRQIYVPVHDLDRAVRFYRDTLQIPLLFQAGSLAFLECNGVRLMLSIPENEDFAKASSVLYLQVRDLNEAYKQLLAKGVSFIDEPHLVAKMENVETWMAFFKDSEDNTHALMSEVVS